MNKSGRIKKAVPLWVVLLISVFVGALIVGVFLYSPKNNQFLKFAEILTNIEKKCCDILKGESAGVFAAQASLTFISISVLSVLSDKDHIIYWKNIIESRLVEPPFRCFAAYTTYSITTIGISLFGLAFKNYSLVSIGFLLDIIVLVFLTKSMLDIYFARTRIKRQLEKDFIKSTQEEKDIIFEKLQEYIVKAISSNNFTYLKETFGFIIKNKKLFGTEYKTLMGNFAEADKATVQFFARWFFGRDYEELFISEDEEGFKHLEFSDVFWGEYVSFCKKEYANADFVYDTRLQNLADLFIKRVLCFYNAAATVLEKHQEEMLSPIEDNLINLQKWEESKKFVTDSGKELTAIEVNKKLKNVFGDAIWGSHQDTNTSNAAWYFVYSTTKALVDIFAARIESENQRNRIIEAKQEEEKKRAAAEGRKPKLDGEITLQERYGFNKIFEKLPFYKVFASDNFMPSDAFPEHREFMDFLK